MASCNISVSIGLWKFTWNYRTTQIGLEKQINKVVWPIAVMIPLNKTWRRCFFIMSLPPSFLLFCTQAQNQLFIWYFPNVGLSVQRAYDELTSHRKEKLKHIFKRTNIIYTLLVFASELGASVGSGMKLAMTAKNMTPPKNCVDTINRWINVTIIPTMIKKVSFWFNKTLKTIANPEIPLQETNGVYSVMSQIKERYAQHKTSSKTLHERNI